MINAGVRPVVFRQLETMITNTVEGNCPTCRIALKPVKLCRAMRDAHHNTVVHNLFIVQCGRSRQVCWMPDRLNFTGKRSAATARKISGHIRFCYRLWRFIALGVFIVPKFIVKDPPT